MASVPTPPEDRTRLFVVVTFTVSIAVGLAIAWFGLHGQLGAEIP
jgi:hypothetical protein